MSYAYNCAVEKLMSLRKLKHKAPIYHASKLSLTTRILLHAQYTLFNYLDVYTSRMNLHVQQFWSRNKIKGKECN
jgi:hypothetical protein